ncbi:hypothetical protein AB1L42_01315 [Thalassoglobus sp. JC818]|uniref:hypothetical protein n=1 Tax=Thalassoglobus sp. JC818 TaxID=3232136 RepID=UPI003457F864
MNVETDTNFSDLYNDLAQQGFRDGEFLRGSDEKGVYRHTALLSGMGKAAMKRRTQKQIAAGPLVWQSLANEHGEDVANRIFKNVLSCDRSDHQTRLRWRDVRRIRKAARQIANWESLRGNVARLASLDERQHATEFFDFVTDNIDDFDSSEFRDTHTDYNAALQGMRAWKYTQRLLTNEQPSIYDYSRFLSLVGQKDDSDRIKFVREKAIERNPNVDLKDVDISIYTPEGKLTDDTMKWMANKLRETYLNLKGDDQLNISYNDAKRLPKILEGKLAVSVIVGTKVYEGRERLDFVMKRLEKAAKYDSKNTSAGVLKQINELQGGKVGDYNNTDAAVEAGLAEKKVIHSQKVEARKQNEATVRKFLPGQAEFAVIAEVPADRVDELFTKTEQDLITQQMVGWARCRAQQGEQIDESDARSRLQSILQLHSVLSSQPNESIHGKRVAHGLNDLATRYQEAQTAANQFMKAVTNPDASIDDLTASYREFNSNLSEFNDYYSSQINVMTDELENPPRVKEFKDLFLNNAVHQLPAKVFGRPPSAHLRAFRFAADIAANYETFRFGEDDGGRHADSAGQIASTIESAINLVATGTDQFHTMFDDVNTSNTDRLNVVVNRAANYDDYESPQNEVVSIHEDFETIPDSINTGPSVAPPRKPPARLYVDDLRDLNASENQVYRAADQLLNLAIQNDPNFD